MVSTEPSEKCPGDGLKAFRCYHLIADNIYRLLSSGHYQNSCNNIINNSNSMVIPSQEKDLNRNISNNYIELARQTDNNNQNNSGVNVHSEITQPDNIQDSTIGIDGIIRVRMVKR